ncbi:MAG: hypothetical protein ACREON_17930 [Gemmatimonadaceae bacterium]
MPISRLAGYGALTAAAGIAGLYALIVFLTIPDGSGGMDWTNTILLWTGIGGIVAVLVTVHLVYARILIRLGNEKSG